MQPVLTAEQMRALDASTTGALGLDGRVLMACAARAVLDSLQRRWPQARRLLVLAGAGNNGGDGLALAYFAHQRGLEASVEVCTSEPLREGELSPEAGYYYELCQRAFVPITSLNRAVRLPESISRAEPDVIVDALFGTGLSRPLGEFHVQLIERLNQTTRPIIAVDIPSGLSCDSGVPQGAAVEADATVTFGALKRGLLHPRAWRYTGEVEVAEIGLASLNDAGVTPSAFRWPDALWSALTRPRAADAHKGDFGKVLIVAGHRKYPGAPRLCASASLRMGAGLVRLVVPEPAYALCGGNPAVMLAPHPAASDGGFAATPSAELREYLDWCDALVIGPGLGDGEAVDLAAALLEARDVPAVVDADALPAAARVSGMRSWPLLLTPHAGELAHLASQTVDDTLADWFGTALAQAERLGAYVLAKSNQTLLASPEGDLFFAHAGHPALATGGSGDVLSGMLGALLARLHVQHGDGSPQAYQRRLGLVEVTLSAVNIHACAARLVAERMGENGVIAPDLVDVIPRALSALQCPCRS